MRLFPAFSPFLLFGALAASAQLPKDGAYVLVDSTVRKYILYEGTFRHQTTWGSTYGGLLTIEDMAWKAGRASFCIDGRHSWSDYGWTDYDECLAGNIVPGRRIILPPQSSGFSWTSDTGVNILAVTKGKDSLNALLTVRRDTVRLSFWWIHASGSQSIVNLFPPGNMELKDIDTLTRRLARMLQINTSTTIERLTVHYYSMAYVPAGTVGLDRRIPSLRGARRPGPGRPAAARDPLGRLRDPLAR